MNKKAIKEFILELVDNDDLLVLQDYGNGYLAEGHKGEMEEILARLADKLIKELGEK